MSPGKCFVVLSSLLVMFFRDSIFGGSAFATDADHWPRFRGVNGTGISLQQGIPDVWSETDYAWKIRLEYSGHSSPVIWGKKLFVTSANEGGSIRLLHCLDADTGTQHWEGTVKLSDSPKHLKNSWATSTPTTDGERVYTIFADLQKQIVTAWSFDGTEAWSRDIGPFGKDHGQGVSPIVSHGLVIVPNDQPGPSSVMALRANDGEVVWTAERPSVTTSFSAPLLVPGINGSTQLLCLSQATGLTSLDLMTGKLNWQTPPFPLRTVASLIEDRGIVIAYCGQAGNGKYLAAITTSPDVPSESRILYERKTQLPYVPTSIALDGTLYLWGDSGVISCLELENGNEVWTKRLANVSFSGSPVCIDGRLFGISESGDVYVVRASREYQELGKTSLGEGSHSTPAVANGHLYLRTFHHLMALKAR
jgi:outer membrane protein assembly factor BamB